MNKASAVMNETEEQKIVASNVNDNQEGENPPSPKGGAATKAVEENTVNENARDISQPLTVEDNLVHHIIVFRHFGQIFFCHHLIFPFNIIKAVTIRIDIEFVIIIIFFFRADKNLKAVAGSASPRKKFHGMGTGSFGSVF